MFGNKRKNLLPLADVEIRAWPEQNFLFGILQEIPCGTDWLMNHFIQMRGAHYIDYEWDTVDASVTFYPYGIHQLTPNMFDLCPFLDKYTLPKPFVRNFYRDFTKFVKDAVDGGYYISVFLDQFFRKDMAGNYGFHHPTFIYGYDDGQRKIYIADNFENGKYGKKEISYSQLNRAFNLVPGDLWVVSIFLYKVVPFHFEYVHDYVMEQIEDYINPNRGICYFDKTVCPESFHNDEKYLNEVFFGIDCYRLLDKCLEAVIQDDPEYSGKDWRSLVQLCDHKHLMVRRYEYMCKEGHMKFDEELLDDLKRLETECLIAQNMYVKYTVSGNKEIIKRLRERLLAIRDKDILLMRRLLGE